MMKRGISIIALFALMAIVGGVFAVMLAEPAMAIPNVDQCYGDDCTEGYRPLYYLSNIHCCGCEDPTPYAVWKCDGRCDGGGHCSCEFYSCHQGF